MRYKIVNNKNLNILYKLDKRLAIDENQSSFLSQKS